MSILKVLSVSSFSVAAILLLIGVSTYWWVPVEVKIGYIEEKNICLSGYTSTHRYDLNSTRSPCSYMRVKYYYTVENKEYSSSFIGFYVPVNVSLEKPTYGNISKAYYVPFYKGFSVLKNGVDYLLILILLIIGLILFYIRALIVRYQSRRS